MLFDCRRYFSRRIMRWNSLDIAISSATCLIFMNWYMSQNSSKSVILDQLQHRLVKIKDQSNSIQKIIEDSKENSRSRHQISLSNSSLQKHSENLDIHNLTQTYNQSTQEPKPTCLTTVVTAYYRVESKFNHDVYIQWMRYFFESIQACIIVYTDVPEVLATFQGPLVIVESRIKLTSFMDSLHTSDDTFWTAQLHQDTEREAHKSYKLYWVWMSKIFFVDHAANWNPFASDFFAWLDIGILRNQHQQRDLTNYIPSASFDRGAVLYGQVEPFQAEDLSLSPDGLCHHKFERQVRLAGGLFLIHKSMTGQWKDAFIQTWRQYALVDKYFAGKDQDILAVLCIQRTDLCQLVASDPPGQWYTVWDFMTTMQEESQFPVFRLHPLFPACYIEIMNNLPHDGVRMRAHHWDAGHTDIWNEHERWNPFSGNVDTIAYVGANTQGADGVKLSELFPNAVIHMYEPIKAFFEELTQAWGSRMTQRFHLHNYGLGASTREVRLTMEQLQGQSTFAMQEVADKSSSFTTTIQIIDVLDEFKAFTPDLLHVNCEGCEWEMLGRLKRFPRIVQVSLHYLPLDMDPKKVAWTYCQLRQALNTTHKLQFGMPFGWQRWVARD